MATIDINSGAIGEHLAKAAAALKDGYVIVAPLENSYALVADLSFTMRCARCMYFVEMSLVYLRK